MESSNRGLSAAQLFVKCLEAEGVDYIFGVPGEENEAFLFALAESNIQFVPTRHEQGAAFIANVIGRITGKAGICLSTLGPGATNLITGVADAYLDKSPVVAITAQGGIDRMHHESHQLIDIVQMFKPITKWNDSIKDPDTIPEFVRKAFKLAEMEKPGATHIELSEDIASLQVDSKAKPLTVNSNRRPAAHPASIKEAIQMIQRANKILILAGNGAIRNRASKALTEFSMKYNFPVSSTFMGKGAVSDKLSTALGSVGLGFKDYVIEAFEQADLILTIGYDIAEFNPANWNIGEKKKIIHIDFEPSEVYTEYIPDLELIGDIGEILQVLSDQLNQPARDNWFYAIRDRVRHSIEEFSQSDQEESFHVPGVIAAVREIMDDDGLLISDVGSHKMWIARNYQTYTPNGCIISNGLASMGIALPGGIAAKIVDPNRQVVSLMGDGGAMMNIQELETAKRMKTGYCIVICNDNNYGLIEWKQKRNTNSSTGTKLTNPDFTALARSFDIPGFKPNTIGAFKSILKKHLNENKLCVIEMPIDPSVNESLTDELNNYFNS
ncbi:MAG: acetolactate synthase large subunit [Saprospiraceae bacterium]|nr:acetolactate synthase large subunit [Saprospiraceae bacterium]